MSVTLTKEQAAILLPLLPNLAELVTAAQPEETVKGGEAQQEEPSYSISEMFEMKKKNTRSTIAQNYLLVSTCLWQNCLHVLFICSSTRYVINNLLRIYIFCTEIYLCRLLLEPMPKLPIYGKTTTQKSHSSSVRKSFMIL